MIKNLSINGKVAPIVVCDACGERIKDATMAAVLTSGAIVDGDSAEVKHVHKGQCHDAMEKTIDGHGWEEMDRHLLQLIYNAGLSIDKLEARRQTDNDVGGYLYSTLP